MSPRARLAWLLAVPVVLAYAYCALRLLAAQLTREMALVGSAFVPSDLFVPWLGARALLAGRSPYTVEFATQLHQLVYGHVVTPSADFQNVATFQYPPFVLAYLFPLMPLPFELVRWLAVALLALCLVLSSHLWLRLVSPSSTRATQAGVGLASVLFFPSLQTLVLQQLSGLVVLLLVAGAYHAARRRVVLAGILLGLAMLKPQLAALPVLSVVVWSVLRPDRRRLALSCGLTVTALLALSYLVLGDWPRQFLVALDRYRAYNTVYWVPEKLLGHTPAIAFSAAVLAILAWRWWRVRSLPFRSPEVLRAFSLTCVCTLVLVPDVSFYHRALLLAPLVTLAVQPRAGTALARSCHRLALLGAAAPVALLAFAALLLARGPETEFVVAILSASEASLIALPLVLLPAFLVPTTPVSFVAPRRALRAAGRGAAALAAAAAGVAYVQVSGDAALSHLRAAYLESGRPFFSSDLFQPWYAGRAMLAGVNPYSPAFASQLHQIVYGRPFAPGPAGHAEMQFFYPPFVALSVAPFLPLPFDAARFLAAALLALAVGAAAWLWARTSGFTRRASVVAVVLGLLFFPTQEIVWIQQLSGLAVFFVIAAFAAASRRRYALSGALVALAFVKPQLSLIPAAPLLLWSLAHRRRWPLWISCAVATAAQLVLAELLVPGWIAPFLTTTRSYGAVNQADWLPGLLTGSAGAGAALCLVIAAVTAAAWWRCRHVDAADPRWLHAAALTFAARSLVVPDVSYYNRALLIAPLITALSLLPRAGATRRVATHLALVVSSLHLPLLAFVGVARWSGLADLLSPALTSGAQVSLFLLPVFVFTCLTPFRLPVLRLARSASPSPVGVAA